MTQEDLIIAQSNEIRKLNEEIAKLEKEKQELLTRLGISEAYRFCQNPTVIIR